jgi:hypothetical protein
LAAPFHRAIQQRGAEAAASPLRLNSECRFGKAELVVSIDLHHSTQSLVDERSADPRRARQRLLGMAAQRASLVQELKRETRDTSSSETSSLSNCDWWLLSSCCTAGRADASTAIG